MTSSLKGRTALVTGAGRGIGRAIALELAERGVSVALVARSRDELAGSAASVRDLGGSAVVIEADIGGNAYVTGKAALEAHTVNLAAELADSGVTVNVYRPGSVDTAMQAWIRGQDPDRIGAGLHRRFTRSYDEGTLISPERSAKSLVDRLPYEATGQIWDVREPG